MSGSPFTDLHPRNRWCAEAAHYPSARRTPPTLCTHFESATSHLHKAVQYALEMGGKASYSKKENRERPAAYDTLLHATNSSVAEAELERVDVTRLSGNSLRASPRPSAAESSAVLALSMNSRLPTIPTWYF